MQYAFGSGALFGRSTTTTPASPVQFGGLQNVSIDFSFNIKELYGQYQFPIALGRGFGKISGKSQFAQFNAQLFNELFFGLTNPSTGEVKTAVSEAKTVSANIVTATNNTTYSQDLGVVYSANGIVLTRVTSGTLVGQYSCNETTGVYTFNNTDNAVAMLISYNYTDASNGKKITLTNQSMGNAPQFIAVFTETFSSKQMTLVLNACVSSKLTMATKIEDFAIPDFDFSAFADSTNAIGTLSFDE